MAAVKNTHALTASTDGSDAGATFNVDTVNNVVQIPNGASLNFYSDAYSTLTASYGANGKAPLVSATSPDPGAAGTITTAGVETALVTPAASRAGIILQAGTYNGQRVRVVNQAIAARTLTFDTIPGTSNVADSATEGAIAGLTARDFVWIAAASLWYQVKGA